MNPSLFVAGSGDTIPVSEEFLRVAADDGRVRLNHYEYAIQHASDTSDGLLFPFVDRSVLS